MQSPSIAHPRIPQHQAYQVAVQVRNAARQWVAADPIPGTLVCNIGDMLRVWTNGLYTVSSLLSSEGTAHVLMTWS